jgi:hypothetical protein
LNDLSRLLAPDDTRDALRSLGGLLIGIGLFMVFVRKSSDALGGTWGDWGLFGVLLIAFAFLYGVGMVGRLSTPVLRPWESGYIIFGVLLAPFLLLQFVTAVNGNPGAGLNIFWIFLVTLALGTVASLLAGVRYGLLLASLAAIVYWSALWNEILSNGLANHYGIYRGLLLILAALLLAGAFAVYYADRSGWMRRFGGVEGERELARSRGNEIVTGAAVAAVIAGSLSLTKVFASPFFALQTASSSLFWEIVLLVVSLAAVGYGGWLGTRGTAYVGAFGLLFFLVIAGADLNDSSPEGKIVGWPLVLLIVGAAAFVASLLPQVKLPDLGPMRRGAAAPGAPPPGGGPPSTETLPPTEVPPPG